MLVVIHSFCVFLHFFFIVKITHRSKQTLKFSLIQETTVLIKKLQIVSKNLKSLHLHKSTSNVLDVNYKRPIFYTSFNEFLDKLYITKFRLQLCETIFF